ncbi:PilN domain-containing protein [Lederbergia graminis]|uniref:PilN domain-containing protein n=2 Tax=Lederbergia graminis TaxID=735518 RepID=A0ABW0LNZ1_9BACI
MMRIDINLLQQPEKKERHTYAYVMVLILVVILALFLFFLQHQKQTKERLTEELQQIRQEIEQIEQNVATDESLASVEKLQSVIEMMEEDSMSVIPILHHFTSILPQDGYIQSIDYVNDEISLEIEFTNQRHAAYYLAELNRTTWVTTATLQTINQVSSAGAEDKTNYIAYYSITLDNQLAGRE